MSLFISTNWNGHDENGYPVSKKEAVAAVIDIMEPLSF